MSDDILITFNPGSSSIKLGLFAMEPAGPRRLGRGEIDLRHPPLALHIVEGPVILDIPLAAHLTEDLHEVIGETLDWLGHHFAVDAIHAVGHRVVHGGDRFGGPTEITPEVLAAIADLVPLAPLHQPHSVRLMRALAAIRPDVPQYASFDTAFHRTQADLVRRFALPRELFDAGIKRYGFHGLSYKFIAGRLAEVAPDLAKRRVLTAHLGSGASICAMLDGKSRDSSMGFSTLDGVPMATRPGALDAGVLLHLVQQLGWSVDRVEDLLYHRSGLIGMSGISADSRDLVASAAPEAVEALAVFALRVARELSAAATTIGGVDALVFTAGIGEHQPPIRAAICAHLAWLGVDIDADANAANVLRISTAGSPVTVFVLPTDEEQVIATEAAGLYAGRDGKTA